MYSRYARSLPARAGAVSAHAVLPADNRLRVAFAGDSNTEHAFHSNIAVAGLFARSNAPSLTLGEGTLTLYSNSTATWQAAGDTVGPVTSVGSGFAWLESGTADKGVCFNIVASTVAALGGPSGTSYPIVIEAETDIGRGENSPVVFGQILSGQKMICTGNFGVSGETTSGLLERVGQTWTHNSYGIEVNDQADVVVVMIGINNYGLVSAAQTLLDLAAIKDAIVEAGRVCVIATLADEAPDAGLWSFIQAVNAGVEAMADERNVRIWHVFNAVRDPGYSDGRSLPNAMDGVHFLASGSKLAGQLLADLLMGMSGGAAGRSDFRASGRRQTMVINGALAGSSASKGGMTGDVAVDSIYSGTGTCVASKQAVAGENDWQVYTITASAAGDQLLMMVDCDFSVGQEIYSECEFSVAGDGVRNIGHVLAFTDDDTQSRYIKSCAIYSTPTNVGALSGVLRTPAAIVPAFATGSNKFLLTADLSAGDTVIKVRDLGAALVHE